MIATAAAQHAFLPPNLLYWVPVLRQPSLSHAPLTKSISTRASDVITQGLHLGNDEDDPSLSGYADDTPASVITQGPRPGAYTSVSSDEASESTQFHSQDGLGQFVFGHSSPRQARLETRSADGNVRGSYSYINPEGRTIKVSYTAGEGGFQAVEDDKENGVFPKPVTETPEVKAARALHARLFDQAKWLAESTPEENDPSIHADTPVSVPAYVPPSVPAASIPGSDADHYHPPDSLYTNVGSIGVESDEGLEYYGAAKGTPITKNSPSYDTKVPYAQTGAYHFPEYRVDNPGFERKLPLAYSGAYHFPDYRVESSPVLSAYSAPSLREQQHLHRAAPDIQDTRQKSDSLRYTAYSAPTEVNSREQQHLHRAAPPPDSQHEMLKFSSYSVPSVVNSQDKQHLYRAALGAAPQIYSAFHTDYLPSLDALEYYGAAKLLAYSAGNLLNNNEKQGGGHRGGKSMKLPTIPNPESYYSSYRQYSPVYVAVAPQPASDDTPSTRTALDDSRPVVPPASVSQKAAYFGAAPVAAVHDAQVAPGQQVKDHQKLPVYIEAN